MDIVHFRFCTVTMQTALYGWMCTLLLVKGWWQQTVQELHLSITMQPMALCMLWTEWSVLSLKLLLSFSHRITSSLYSYPVSYLTSGIFSSRNRQHCPVTKICCDVKFLFENLMSHKYLFVEFDVNVIVHRDKFLTVKRIRCTNYSVFFFLFFLNETLHVSDTSSVHHQEFSTVHTAMLYVIQVCGQLSAYLYDI